MAASLDNIFGSEAPAGGAAASSGPSIDNIFGSQAKVAGPSIDSIFKTGPLLKEGESAFPASAKAPVSFAMPKLQDTSSMFKKSVGMLDTSMAKIGGETKEPVVPPKQVGSEFADYKNPFAAPLANIGIKVPTSIAEPGSNLESVIKAGKAAGEQLRGAIQKPLATTFNFTKQQAEGLMPQDNAYKNGNRKLNYGDIANLVPKLFVQSGLPNAALDIAEPIESKLTGQTGGSVKFPSFNNDPIQAQGVETDYEQRIAAGQSDKEAFWGSTLNLGLDLAVLIPLARSFAKIGITHLTPDSLLESMKFNTKELRTFLQTGEPMPKDLHDAFVKLPDKQKSELARGLITEIKSPTPSLLGKILGVSEQEAKEIFQRTGTPIPPPPLKALPSGTFESVLKDEIKTALNEQPESVVSQALQEHHGLPAEYADHAIRIVKGDKSVAEAKALHEKIAGDILAKRSDEQISKDTESFAEKNFPTLVDSYIEKHSNYVGADEAKELLPGYSQDRSVSDLVQKSAGKISEAVYNKLLDSRKGKANDVVLITGGATGAGKSTLLRGGGGFDYKHFAVVLDSNLSHGESAIARINKALDKGYKVHIAFVSTPVREAYARVLGRAEQMTKEKGSARPVSAQGHIDMHHGSADAMVEIIKAFEKDSRVHIDIFNNAGKDPVLVEHNLAFIEEISHNKEDVTTLHKELNDQRQEAYGEGKISDKTNNAFERAEKLRPKKDQPKPIEISESGDKKQPSNVLARPFAQPRGMVAPGAIAEDIVAKAKEVAQFIEETNKKVAISAETGDDLYKLETNNKRDLEIAIRLIKSIDMSAADAEAIYHFDDGDKVTLNERQQQLYDNVIKPLADASEALFSKLKNDGLPMQNEDYTPRNVKGKGGPIDRIVSAIKEKKEAVSAGQGGILTRSHGSMKHRTMRILIDGSGKRTVVSVKGGHVMAFINKEPVAMGSLKARRSSKIKEFFDPVVRGQLETLAKSLGIKHERHATGKTAGLGGQRAGVSFQGENLIKTRLSPDSVLAHEIGHQIDYKYGMQKRMKEERYDAEYKTQILAEMRDLADARFEGKEVTENFKKYVRKGTEKMAVMFEAYISNKEMFKEVAPHLYDEFRDFLAEHPELKPFLDIEGSVQLDSALHGGELLAGKSGSTFIDRNGKSYTIGEATTREIEAATNLEYHKNVLANRMLQYLKLQQIDRANQFIEDFKNHPDFENIAVKTGEEAPANFKPTRLPQFRGYMLEPRIAEHFDRMADKMTGPGGVEAMLAPVGRFLRNAIFFNPFIHVPNLTVHWLVNRGLSRFATPQGYIKGTQSFARAWNAVIKHNDDYLVALEHGAPLLASDANSRELGRVLLEKMATELDTRPEVLQEVAKALGYANPANLVKAIYRFSNKFTWTINDLFTMQAVYEDMAAKGLDIDTAIKETGKHIPNYRIPPRIFDKEATLLTGEKAGGIISHGLSSMMSSSALSMFGAYHYGALRSYGELTHDLINKESDAGKRASVLDKLAMLALIGLVLYPYVLDKFAQAITGNANAKFRRAGSTTLPDNVMALLRGEKDAGQVFQSVVTPAPLAKAIPELVWNRDFWNDQQVYGPAGEGFLNFVTGQLAPVQQGRQVASGQIQPINFFASLIGISSPKSSTGEKMLTAMIYNEKPVLQKQMKELVVAGDVEGAKKIGHDFNVRMREEIKNALVENGKEGTEAQITAVLNKDGIRMPGVEAINNYKATAGLPYIDKLSSDGKPQIKTDTPIESDSFIHTVVNYAHALAIDPSTALHDILHGQVIRKVDNGTIIVYRMSLADSQAVKTAGGGNNPTMKLDHTLPLQLGGTNEEANLNLIPTEQWASYTPVEDYLGTALRGGKVDKATAQKLILNFKNGIITFDDIKKEVEK